MIGWWFPVRKAVSCFSTHAITMASFTSSPRHGNEYDFDEDDSFDLDDDLDSLDQASDEGNTTVK